MMRRNSSLLSTFTVIFSFSFLLFGCGTPQVSPDFPKWLGAIERERTRAEESVTTIHSAYNDQRINDQTYDEAKRQYRDASASFNAWITQFQTTLEAGSSPVNSEEFKQSLENAVTQAELFINWGDETRQQVYVDALANEEIVLKASVPSDIVLGVFDGLIKIADSLFKWYQEADREQRKTLIDRLDQLRWKSFEELTQ